MAEVNINDLIATEVKRLSEKYKKEYLDCEDLIKIIGIGRENVRKLMRCQSFPTIRIGKRIVVSVFNFVTWQVKTGYIGE